MPKYVVFTRRPPVLKEELMTTLQRYQSSPLYRSYEWLGCTGISDLFNGSSHDRAILPIDQPYGDSRIPTCKEYPPPYDLSCYQDSTHSFSGRVL